MSSANNKNGSGVELSEEKRSLLNVEDDDHPEKTYHSGGAMGWIHNISRENMIIFSALSIRTFFSVANRVSYKIMLVPMSNYGNFISMLMAFCYTFFYFIILGVRYRRGIITKKGLWSDECLGVPKKKIVVMGLMDALGNVLGFVSAGSIAGTTLTIIAQMIIPFSIIATYFIVGRRYNWKQLVSAALVMGGIFLTLIPQFRSHQKSDSAKAILINVIGIVPNAISYSIKELVFKEMPQLDIFVVNSFDSLFQLGFTILLFPIVSVPGVGEVPFDDLGGFLEDAGTCFGGTQVTVANSHYHITKAPKHCDAMPWLWIAYVFCNLSFNIIALATIKYGGAVLNAVAGTMALTLQNLSFYIHWPYLGAASFSVWAVVGFVVTIGGLVIYRWQTILWNRELARRKAEKERQIREGIVPTNVDTKEKYDRTNFLHSFVKKFRRSDDN